MSGWISLTPQKQRKVFTQTHWCVEEAIWTLGPMDLSKQDFIIWNYCSTHLHCKYKFQLFCWWIVKRVRLLLIEERTDNVRVIVLFLLAILLVYLKLSIITVYAVLWQEDFNRISDENIDMLLLTTIRNILPLETLWITYFWTFP